MWDRSLHFKPFLALSMFLPHTGATELQNSPLSLSLSLPLSAPSLWPCSVLPLPSPTGSPKCSLCSWYLHRFFSAFPVDITHLTSTHSHRDSGLQGPIQRESFHLPHPSPRLPLSKHSYILSQGVSRFHRHFLSS